MAGTKPLGIDPEFDVTPNTTRWHIIAAYGLIGWLVIVSLTVQAVILLWSVRALGSELPFDLRHIAAVAALLFMFYATLESQRVRWMRERK